MLNVRGHLIVELWLSVKFYRELGFWCYSVNAAYRFPYKICQLFFVGGGGYFG